MKSNTRCLNDKIGHHTTSQGAESRNRSNLTFRGSYFGDILGLANNTIFRFDGRKKDALRSSEEGVPPRRLKDMKKELELSAHILANQVKIINSNQALLHQLWNAGLATWSTLMLHAKAIVKICVMAPTALASVVIFLQRVVLQISLTIHCYQRNKLKPAGELHMKSVNPPAFLRQPKSKHTSTCKMKTVAFLPC